MIVKEIKKEDFVNYRKPSMFIGMGDCDYKCCIEAGIDKGVCQNSALHQAPDISIPADTLVDEYLRNPITEAVVLGGLDPLCDFASVMDFVIAFRGVSNDDIVIYTGYNQDEIHDKLVTLSKYPNIIVKVGRYVPNDIPRYDDVLGVTLASSNQYAIKLYDYQVIINPDKELVRTITSQLKENGGYCPCRLVHNADTKCKCAEFRKQLEDFTWYGECHCGLYIKTKRGI